MKTKLHSSICILHSSIALAVASTLCLAVWPAEAQADSVTISAAEFQRMVYSAHLHTQLALKPELQASLQVLLELQRRNPNSSPAALADLSRQTLQRYRTSAPYYIRINGLRDEILAAYLDALLQVPARTNFVPANLTLLSNLRLGPADYNSDLPPATLICSLVDSGNQRLFSSEREAIKRQALVDDCVARALGNAAFGTAIDSLLLPETGVALRDGAAAIIGNTNSPLHDSPTMTNLLALSQASGNGTLTVSSNQLMHLFTNEMQVVWNTVRTNLTVLSQINQSQPDLLAYLTNQAAIDANVQLQAAVQQGQQARLASAAAAVLVQSKLLPVNTSSDQKEQIEKSVCAGAQIGAGIVSLCFGNPNGLGSLMSGALGCFDIFSGGQSAQDAVANQLSNVQTLMGDLSTNMNYRFDRVDQSLTTIFDTMNRQFALITNGFDVQGRLIAHLTADADEIRGSLVDVQARFDRLEQDVFYDFATSERNQYLIGPANSALFYGMQNPGRTMTWNEYAIYPNYEGSFYSYAASYAADNIFSPYQSLDLATAHLEQQLATRPLDANLNYIAQFLSTNLAQHLVVGTPLANPQEWFMGAYAYLQLAAENPMLFREKGLRIPAIITVGQDLANFLGSLTFHGTSVNWPLYTALENYYLTNLISFNAQVSATEGQYATNNNFALGPWRNWDAAAPRVRATATETLLFTPKKLIAAGAEYSLALKADGTVVGWGDNSYGQTTIPAGLTNAVAITAGNYHSLALKANGTVAAWGSSTYGQLSIPLGVSNVAAIAAGATHCLALKSDGTVVGWGNNASGQTSIPADLTNVVALAAGADHSLALKADGTVVGWGGNAYGQTNIPAGLTDVVAIAAGANHNLALRADGTVVGWGFNYYGQATDVPQPSPPFAAEGIVMAAGQPLSNVAAIAAGESHSLALLRDGTVFGWGANSHGEATGVLSSQIPPIGSGVASVAGTTLSGVVAIAADGSHSLALRTDGTVVGWGENEHHQGNPPGWLSRPRVRTHIAAGGSYDQFGHGLALKADGTIVAWGDNFFGQTTVPASATNLVSVAAGYANSLALKADGTVLCWGLNQFSQNNIPANATNLVAIAAGGYHNLALRADGTVVGWGDNSAGQSTIPATATNVLAIVAGPAHSLALKADGTVVGWGWDFFGQTDIPPGTTDVVAIAAIEHSSLALRSDGTFVCWGFPLAVPASATNLVAVAGGDTHFLALRADGTVVGWGDNTYGESTIPVGLTNVLAIAAGGKHSLALKADGTVVGWGANGGGQVNIPTNVIDLAAWGEHSPGLWNIPPVSSPITAVAAGSAHCLALTASGSVVAWGLNTWAQTDVPPQAQSGVQAVAAGFAHSLALTTNGSVLAWGLNNFGQANVPAGLSNVVSVAAGADHSLALKADGTVVAWGLNGSGQTNVPSFVPGQMEMVQGHVVAIGAGGEHSLALTADGMVVAWGGNADGQTSVPPGLSDVVAIAAGRYHNLALTSAGQVVAWGLNTSGQCNVPAATHSGVVAIAAGITHSLALKADGTVVAWGSDLAAFLPPQARDNIVALAAGDQHSLLLRTCTLSDTDSIQTLSFVRAQIPRRVGALIQSCNQNTLAELGRAGGLNTTAGGLSGAKVLLADVLELGMPYTLARDSILHGFLYGSESLTDSAIAADLLQAQNALLQTNPTAPAPALVQVDWMSFTCFRDRLNQCLTNLQANGQPEIPRLVGHTLRLLNLLRDAWTQPTNSPPTALEIWSEANSPRLLLYGEPYMRYTLQYRDSLNVPGWTTSSITNLQEEQTITILPPFSTGAQRFYRVMLPGP